MEGSKENPVYTVFLLSDGITYELTPAMVSIKITDRENQIAKSLTLKLMQLQVNGIYLSDLIKARDRIFLYADDGERKEEVFRGIVWERSYASSLKDKALTVKCYDNLIYFQESEESTYFSAGRTSKDLISALCGKWGVPVNYNYETITHGKMVLRGKLADILTGDILDLVKERTGKKYIISSEKDAMMVKTAGSNKTVYLIRTEDNALETKSACSMSGMVTKVVVQGKADKDDRRPVEAVVQGHTDKYGTLQKIIKRTSSTSLAEAKKEAASLIKEKGAPKWQWEVTSLDIPWLQKGDKVKIEAGDMVATLLVSSIDRTISNSGKEMALTLETMS